jgi:carboxypeptidase Taq
MGGMGYFPTYSLGNFLSVQLFEAAVAETPSIPADIETGHFNTLFDWLARAIWTDGRRRFPDEQVRKATGRPLETAPYVAYLKRKARDVYGIAL